MLAAEAATVAERAARLRQLPALVDEGIHRAHLGFGEDTAERAAALA